MTISTEPYEVDARGERRPSSSEALKRLIDAIVPEQPNPWMAADEAVEGADEETVRHACRKLLGLHLIDLDETEPQVAMRNVRESDYVRLHGTMCYVERVSNPESQTITLKVRLHRPDGPERTFAYDRDVRIPLVGRQVAVR